MHYLQRNPLLDPIDAPESDPAEDPIPNPLEEPATPHEPIRESEKKPNPTV